MRIVRHVFGNMAATAKRLYVGGLFEGITENELRQRFSKFGEIGGIEIRKKHDATSNLVKVFAYVNIKTTEADLAKCFKIYSNTKWKGCEITLQIAKENFLQRLQKEREEKKSFRFDARHHTDSLPEVTSNQNKISPVQIQSSKTAKASGLADGEASSSSSDDESSKPAIKVGKFAGTKSILPPVSEELGVVNMDTSSDSDEDEAADSDDSTDTITLIEKRKSSLGHQKDVNNKGAVDGDLSMNRVTLIEKQKSSPSYSKNIKRAQDGDDSRVSFIEKQKASPSYPKNVNNIRAQDFAVTSPTGPKLKSNTSDKPQHRFDKTIESLTVPTSHFNGSKQHSDQQIIKPPDVKINDDNNDDALKRNLDNEKRLKSLEEKKSVIQMQKLAIKKALSGKGPPLAKKIKFEVDDDDNVNKPSPHHQKPFQLFNESDGEDSDKDDAGNIDSALLKPQFQGKHGYKLLDLQSKFHDERFKLDERFLEPDYNKKDARKDTSNEEDTAKKVVEDMFGSPTKKTPQTIFKIPRYDPTQEDAQKFEIHRDEATDKPKKKKKKGSLDESAEPALPEVSTERYYEVSLKSLKDAFDEDKKNGFSLLEQLGHGGDSDSESVAKGSKMNDDKSATEFKRPSFFRVNPFDRNPFRFESSDEDEDEADSKNAIQFMAPVSTRVQKKTRSFFFLPNDHRLKDGLEFYRKESLDVIEKKWRRLVPAIKQDLRKRKKKALGVKNKRKRQGFVKKKKSN